MSSARKGVVTVGTLNKAAWSESKFFGNLARASDPAVLANTAAPAAFALASYPAVRANTAAPAVFASASFPAVRANTAAPAVFA